jgi:magnesium chelatase subunit H
MPSPTSHADAPEVRVVFITLDRHVAGAIERARSHLQAQVPNLVLDLHFAADWASQPDALTACRDNIARADIIIATMLFVEDHVQAVRDAILERRDSCDAVLACVSAAEIVKLTRLGRFDMSKKQSGPIALLKRLRGKPKEGGSATAGAKQVALLRQLPRILRFIPGTAQDVRAYFISMQYWLAGSDGNLANLILYLVNRYAAGPREELRGAVNAAQPVEYPDVGLYHPRARTKIGTDLTALPRPAGEQKGTVGLLLMRSYVLADDTGHYDGMIAELEARGLKVVPAFASGLDSRPAIEAYFQTDGVANVDAVLSLTGFSLVGGPAYNDSKAAQEALSGLDVPYLAAHALEFQSIADWRRDDRGLMPIESTIMVAIPEIDGATSPTVFGGRIAGDSACQGCDRNCQSRQPAMPATPATNGLKAQATVNVGFGKASGPMTACAERTEHLADRVARLVTLRRSERAERRLAVVLFNFPPNAGATGTAAYLSVFESVFNTLKRLKAEGYTVDVPESVDALRTAVLEGNAARYGADANVHAEITVDDHVRRETYLADIEAQWGPAPGRQQADGRAIQVLGKQFGNVLVSVQPGFGYEGDPMRLLFERGFAPTHAFSAFYRYLREDFAAHAVVHYGTHGALEFMPGKQTGLSDACWPERLIGDLPNIYLYAANNPSEGAIAKRRSAATLVSYLTPAVAHAGLYRGLADLKASLERWRGTDATAEEERTELARLILDQAAALDLIGEDVAEAGHHAPIDPAQITALNAAVLELEYTLIPHGLHVIGNGMPDNEMAELLQSIGEASHDVQLSEDIVERIVAGDRTVDVLHRLGQKATAAERAAVETLATARSRLGGDPELDGLVRALDAQFIEPVAGGDVLRTIDILPTGRNIHGFDPFRLPSAFAVQDGARQAARILDRHTSDGHALPETVAIVLWGTDNLKSEGSPLSQALALMGAKPRFDSFGRLAGADLMPLEDLGRPRIDVIMTLSGIFRDLLPLQIKLLAEAALKAATRRAGRPELCRQTRPRLRRRAWLRNRGCGAARLLERRWRLWLRTSTS